MGSIHLIRHGQASWGTDDYDRLSTLGRRQSDDLGAAWEAGDFSWTSAFAGSMVRHAQTAVGVMEGCERGDGHDVDAGWDEYDFLQLLAGRAAETPSDPRDVQRVLNEALADWVAGADGAGESFAEFADRVRGAFDRAVRQAGSGRRVVVFTSGGPIALITSQILTGGPSLFVTLNNVVVNASVTSFIVGSTGTNLLAFNEHTHLPPDRITFR